MQRPNPNAFIGNPLDRVGVQRKDPDWVASQLKIDSASFLPFHTGMPLIDRGEARSRLQWLTMNALPQNDDLELILLGLSKGEPRWAIDVTPLADPETQMFDDLGEYIPLRNVSPFLSANDLSIAGQAMWVLDWHRRHQFCARSGQRTLLQEGGAKRVNPETGTEHFPRTDPVAIVLPIHEDSVCLGRSPNFPPNFYSAFAGYVEACESLEECAERELFEETGLKATHVEYIFNQPWPFTSALMVGFISEVENKNLTLDPDEIEDARWFSRVQAQELLDGKNPDGLISPPKFTVAHQLLQDWLRR